MKHIVNTCRCPSCCPPKTSVDDVLRFMTPEQRAQYEATLKEHAQNEE